MDLRHLVSVDHANIRQIADQTMRSVGSSGPAGRDSLFDQFDNEVRRHMMLMDKVVMPGLQKGNGASTSRDMDTTHRGLERLLGDLDVGDKTTEEWTSRFDTFRDELDRVFGEHMQMIGSMSGDRRDLARQYERAKIKAIRSGGYVSRFSGRRKQAVGIGLGLGALAALAAVMWQRRTRRDSDDLEWRTRERLLPVPSGRTTAETTTVRTTTAAGKSGTARSGGETADAPIYTAH